MGLKGAYIRSYLKPVPVLSYAGVYFMVPYLHLLEAWRPPATAHYWSISTTMSAGLSDGGGLRLLTQYLIQARASLR